MEYVPALQDVQTKAEDAPVLPEYFPMSQAVQAAFDEAAELTE